MLTSCRVQLQDGTVWRHQGHIRKHFTEQSEEVTTPLETVPQDELWESTPNLTESSPEGGETSEQKLEEAAARLTNQTKHLYPTRVHSPPERYSDTKDSFYFRGKECNDYILLCKGTLLMYIFACPLAVCLCGTQMVTFDSVRAPSYHTVLPCMGR